MSGIKATHHLGNAAIMRNRMKKWLDSDRGAVAVDWLVLTAGVVALAISTMSLIGAKTGTLATNTATVIQDAGQD